MGNKYDFIIVGGGIVKIINFKLELNLKIILIVK
jgi:hypothetical protein